VDYAVWGAVQQRVYHGIKFNSVEELKTAIIIEWQKLSRFIDLTVASMSGVVVLNVL